MTDEIENVEDSSRGEVVQPEKEISEQEEKEIVEDNENAEGQYIEKSDSNSEVTPVEKTEIEDERQSNLRKESGSDMSPVKGDEEDEDIPTEDVVFTVDDKGVFDYVHDWEKTVSFQCDISVEYNDYQDTIGGGSFDESITEYILVPMGAVQGQLRLSMIAVVKYLRYSM